MYLLYMYENINSPWGEVANSLILIFQFFRTKMLFSKSVLQKIVKIGFLYSLLVLFFIDCSVQLLLRTHLVKLINDLTKDSGLFIARCDCKNPFSPNKSMYYSVLSKLNTLFTYLCLYLLLSFLKVETMVDCLHIQTLACLAHNTQSKICGLNRFSFSD